MNGLMSTVREITRGAATPHGTGRRGRGAGEGSWLGALVDTVAGTLRVPFAALEVDGRIVAGTGGWPEVVTRVPLGYGVETVGALVLPQGRRDARLLDALAGQLARAVHATSVAEAAVRATHELAGAHVPGGLVAALTATARVHGHGVVEVWPLPALSPAVEAAAYRIAAEALANAGRHAPGAPVRVRVRARGAFLDVVVSDGGPGVPAGFTAGAGVHAMRGWAAVVGGSCTVRRGLPGTLVEAMLPLVPVPLVPVPVVPTPLVPTPLVPTPLVPTRRR
ncbi:ATP-binding protein [Pseudonocardia sp. RS010]|uniref:ATP-binding protein n=1 Tax=Pseudonocardia sp. RS010 TaxID=3385979 RepID=UPI0039A3F68D